MSMRGQPRNRLGRAAGCAPLRGRRRRRFGGVSENSLTFPSTSTSHKDARMILHSSRPARLAGGALLSLLLAGALAGCEETRGAGGPPGFGGPPPQVEVMV